MTFCDRTTVIANVKCKAHRYKRFRDFAPTYPYPLARSQFPRVMTVSFWYHCDMPTIAFDEYPETGWLSVLMY